MKSALLSRYTILLAAVILVGVGCKKISNTSNSNTTTITTPDGTTTNPPVAGLGGNAGLRITANHDMLNIDSCLVFIKYDASVVPKDGKYDDWVWAVKDKDGLPVASFDGLMPGNYYLFADGWDLIRSEKVHGGLPFIILEENSSAAHSLVLPVQNYE